MLQECWRDSASALARGVRDHGNLQRTATYNRKDYGKAGKNESDWSPYVGEEDERWRHAAPAHPVPTRWDVKAQCTTADSDASYWETFHLDRYEKEHGRLPLFNKVKGRKIENIIGERNDDMD